MSGPDGQPILSQAAITWVSLMSLGVRLASSHTERVRGAGAGLGEGALAHPPPVSGILAMVWNSDQL